VILANSFFLRPTAEVAADLVGCLLCVQRGDLLVRLRIVETEGYLGKGDEASHSFRGRTSRNSAMFGPAGRLYIYRIYGVHHCANLVTEEEGVGAAVLIRAAEPLEGLPWLLANRPQGESKGLCNGPAKLAQALALDLSHDGQSLQHGGIWLETGEAPSSLSCGPRIGISRSRQLPLRFWWSRHPGVSRKG
jgi:DNA-3-methyladenine glycosylase